jgi:hypothetical protein
MRARRSSFARCFIVALSVSLALAGCGRSPAAPSQPTEDTPSLRIVADPVVTMTQGSALTLTLEERDAAGRIVTQAPGSYTWTSSEPGLVSAGAGGVLTAGPGFGQAIVTARSVGGTTATARVWVQQPRGTPSAYRITLIYADNVPDEWRALLDEAAARWEEVIRGDLPDAMLNNQPHPCHTAPGDPEPPPLTGIERGTRIFVSVSDYFPVTAYAEAIGGPCLQRPLPHPTTILGRISLNAKKPLSGIPPRRRSYLALHEMGHALGLVAVVQGLQPAWYDPKTGRYTGPMALEGYRRDFGASVQEFVTQGGHWPFFGDIMGGGSMSSRVSWASAGGLMDLGYPATWYGAHD